MDPELQPPSFDEVYRLNHEQGMTLKEIAREYGMSWDTVRRMFRGHGATWISRSDFQRQTRHKALSTVLAMREAGRSLQEIATALDTHPRRVKRILQEHEQAVFEQRPDLT